MADPNIPIMTSGDASIDTDINGIMYLRTASGEVEVIDGDVAMTALVRVRQLELQVAALTATIEALLGG